MLGFVDEERRWPAVDQRALQGHAQLKPWRTRISKQRWTQRRIVVCVTEMPRSAIMITRSRRLSLKLVYQAAHKTMICPSKWRPLNRSSIGRNRCISSSSPATLSLHQSPAKFQVRFAGRFHMTLIIVSETPPPKSSTSEDLQECRQLKLE